MIDRNPVKGVTRIFNSAVAPYEDGFVAVLRGEQVNGIPHIYMGYSKDAIHWTIDENRIPFVDEEGKPFMPGYAYDPRLVKVEDTYYIMWCTDFTAQPSAWRRLRTLRPLSGWRTPSFPSTATRCSSPARTTAST